MLLARSTATYSAQPDSGLIYSMQARELAEELDDKASLALALKNAGLAYYVQGQYYLALDYWSQALEQYRQVDDQDGVSNLLGNIGTIYLNRGNDVKAIELYLDALKAAEQLPDKMRMAYSLVNLGAAYDMKKATSQKALEYYQRALPILKDSDDPISYGIALGNVGGVYFEDMHQLDSAQAYYQAAETVFEQEGETDPYTLFRMGEVLAEKGEFSKAIELQQKAYDEASSRDAKLEMAQSLEALGRTYLKSGQPVTAVAKLKEAEALALELESFTLQEPIFQVLGQAYEQEGNYQLAYDYQVKASQVSDSVYNVANDRRIEGLQFQYDLEKKEAQIRMQEIEIDRVSLRQNFLLATAIFLIVTICGISYSYWFARRSNKIITEERNRSESILLNILPEETADELKRNGKVLAKRFDSVTVLFTDFKEFTKATNGIPPEEVVKSVDYYFRAFDKIISRHHLEKIKTIGDSYMCAGGLPIPNATHAEDAVMAGLEIIEFVKRIRAKPRDGIIPFDIRVGVHTGPVVAGVVGTKKFQYDIWGYTVNMASLMEANSIANRLNISSATYERVKDKFEFEKRSKVKSKHGENFSMYFVTSAVAEKVHG